MRQSELEKLYITTRDGTFTPLYKYDSIEPIKDENGAITDYEYIGYQQSKTAQEVYDEWVCNRDNPLKPQPTEAEKIAKYMLDLDYRLSLQELGGK